jgi:pseudouridine synthase
VEVNGEAAMITTPVNPDRDIIEVEGKRLARGELVYIMLNKPPGLLSTCQSGRERGETVLDLVRVPQRIYPVGRLDRDSRGMLLLTNDGDFTHILTHPSHKTEKEYLVELNQEFSMNDLQLLTNGISLNGKNCQFHRIEAIAPNRYRIILQQGIKRQIRLMAKAMGKWVIDLQRIRIGKLSLGDLPEGKWRLLTNTEVQSLKEGVSNEEDSHSNDLIGRNFG